ncbi:hypothetical protein [Dactylosporangium sp. CA-233914]|uniref:hypothetical protein n=1 Tax=Dactylosporangium sp. CA-233914 TaxID=3239934 RepID=UPI003D938F52
MLASIHYRVALNTEPAASPWLTHSELYARLESHGLRRTHDFHLAHLRAGLPLRPGESLLDKQLALAVLTRDRHCWTWSTAFRSAG